MVALKLSIFIKTVKLQDGVHQRFSLCHTVPCEDSLLLDISLRSWKKTVAFCLVPDSIEFQNISETPEWCGGCQALQYDVHVSCYVLKPTLWASIHYGFHVCQEDCVKIYLWTQCYYYHRTTGRCLLYGVFSTFYYFPHLLFFLPRQNVLNLPSQHLTGLLFKSIGQLLLYDPSLIFKTFNPGAMFWQDFQQRLNLVAVNILATQILLSHHLRHMLCFICSIGNTMNKIIITIKLNPMPRRPCYRISIAM